MNISPKNEKNIIIDNAFLLIIFNIQERGVVMQKSCRYVTVFRLICDSEKKIELENPQKPIYFGYLEKHL